MVGQTISHYRIIRELGRAYTGVVYRADVLPEQTHAIGSSLAGGERSYVSEAVRRYFQEHLKP